MQPSKSSNPHAEATPAGAASAAPSAGTEGILPHPGYTARRGGIIGAYIRFMDVVSSVTAVIAGILLTAGVLAVCNMIFVRYVLGQSTTWQTEFTVYSVTGAMLLGSPYVLMTGGHVAVTVLQDAVGPVVRKLMQLLASLVGLAFCIALAYASWHYLIEAYTSGWNTGTVWNPRLWPALVPMAVGATLLSLQYVAEILRGES